MEKHQRRDGRPVDTLGSYHPNRTPEVANLKEESFYEWLKKGAEPSDTIKSLLVQQGFWEKWKMVNAGQDVSGVQPQLKPKKIKPRQPNKKIMARQKAAQEAAAKPVLAEEKKEATETKTAS
jgi:small subunit ribosomal protein S16